MAAIPKARLTKANLNNYAQQQINAYLSPGPVDEELAEQHLDKAYEVAGLKAPTQYVWFDSPVAFSTDTSVRASVRESVWASVEESVGASVRASVEESVRASVRESVRESVWASVRASVYSWLWANDYSFFKFFNDNLEHNDLKHLCLFSEMVNGYLLTADTAYIVRKPLALRRNTEGRLHNDQKPAIEWSDGAAFYYLHGVEFKEELWRKVVNEDIELTDLPSITNADQRAVAVQMLRPDRLLKQVNARLIHTGRKGTELYEVPDFMATGSTEYCMKMQHPSIKGKYYIEWVEPKVGRKGDADLAQATAAQLTVEQYLEAVEA